MLSEVRRISGLSDDDLIPQIREVHQRHGTSEYAFLLEHLPCLKDLYPKGDITEIFDDAIHAYRRARAESLRLYDCVKDTLTALRAQKVQIVLYTESLAYYTNFRIRRLGLDPLIDFIYSPPDHELPEGKQSFSENADAALHHAKHRFVPQGVIKPNPAVLLDIIGDVGRVASECLYLGDSLMKDVAMAQAAGVADVYAKYGSSHHRADYELLRQVSHWKEADVLREKSLSTKDVIPTHSIESFGELLAMFGR